MIFSSKESVEALIKTNPKNLDVIKQMVLLDGITEEQTAKLAKSGIKTIPYKNILN